MNFGQLIVLYSFTTSLGCGAKAGWDAHRWTGTLVGTAIGASVGFMFSYLCFRELAYIRTHRELSKPNLAGTWQLLMVAILFALIVQMFSAAFVSMWLTESVSKHFW